LLNTVFLVIEFIFGRNRLYIGYSIFCVLILGLYLGQVYLVHDVQGIWGMRPNTCPFVSLLTDVYIVYNFFDPTKPNAKVPAFIVGILAAEVVVFFVMWGLIHVRDWIFPRGRGVRVIDRNASHVVV